jgi:hypothetical protein
LKDHEAIIEKLFGQIEDIQNKIRAEISQIAYFDEDTDVEVLMDTLEENIFNSFTFKGSPRFNQKLGSVLSWLLFCGNVNFIGEWSRENEEYLTDQDCSDFPEIDRECAGKLKTILATCQKELVAAERTRKRKLKKAEKTEAES